jgi:prepilin-type N-terminal cleavage/methylation domain-containing protein
MRHRAGNQQGFTLVELMIVVAIIGLLAAIAIPSFLSYQLKAKTSEAKTSLAASHIWNHDWETVVHRDAAREELVLRSTSLNSTA